MTNVVQLPEPPFKEARMSRQEAMDLINGYGEKLRRLYLRDDGFATDAEVASDVMNLSMRVQALAEHILAQCNAEFAKKS